MGPKKVQKCQNTGSPLLDKPVSGRGGGGAPEPQAQLGCVVPPAMHTRGREGGRSPPKGTGQHVPVMDWPLVPMAAYRLDGMSDGSKGPEQSEKSDKVPSLKHRSPI